MYKTVDTCVHDFVVGTLHHALLDLGLLGAMSPYYQVLSIAKFSARNYRTKGQKLSFLDQNYRILNF